MSVFDLSEVQADYILEMQLRRLTKFSRIELEKEKEQLERDIEALTAILDDDALLRKVVSDELAGVAKTYGTPRRTVLLESAGAPATAAVPLEVADDPCWVLLSSSGLVARTSTDDALPVEGGRAKHDVVVSAVRATARGQVAVLTSTGRMRRIGVLEMPALPPTASAPNLSGGLPLTALVQLDKGEQVLGLAGLAADSPGVALGTAGGVVKRVTTDYPSNKDDWEIIGLKPGDEVVGAVELSSGTEDLVFVTSDAQLLRFPAAGVRPQGRAAGGMAGVRVDAGQRVVYFGAVDPGRDAVVVTVSGSADALPGTQAGSVKVTPYADYPPKGRGTGGVRCHRFLRGEDTLLQAWAGPAPARAAAASGVAVELPEATGKRDGSGVPAAMPIAGLAGPAGTLTR
jgi:DNA gyrase subunit A